MILGIFTVLGCGISSIFVLIIPSAMWQLKNPQIQNEAKTAEVSYSVD